MHTCVLFLIWPFFTFEHFLDFWSWFEVVIHTLKMSKNTFLLKIYPKTFKKLKFTVICKSCSKLVCSWMFKSHPSWTFNQSRIRRFWFFSPFSDLNPALKSGSTWQLTVGFPNDRKSADNFSPSFILLHIQDDQRNAQAAPGCPSESSFARK